MATERPRMHNYSFHHREAKIFFSNLIIGFSRYPCTVHGTQQAEKNVFIIITIIISIISIYIVIINFLLQTQD